MTVLEIGPAAVRVICGRPVDQRLAAAALDWIDDPVGLFNERPVAVADLWRAVMAAAAGEQADSLVLVHPDGWTRDRIDRVVAAANAVADQVVAVPRSRWIATGQDDTADEARPEPRPPRRRVRAAGITAAVLATVVAVAWPDPTPSRPDDSTRTVAEGRITVRIPADWPVTRVMEGPGSRRLQAGPPADPALALHITQSYAPEAALERTARVLSQRISDEPTGIFVDFRADGRVAGRPALTYRENRPGRVIDWSLVLVGSTLVGVGCQSPPQRTDAVRGACEQAVASASENGTDPSR